MKINDIIEAIESFAPPSLQENWDNTGLQTGDRNAECTGVMVCVDATERAVHEAVERGCNLLISHHPLFFKGVKALTGDTAVQRTAIAAVRNGVSVYSCHTAVDNVVNGVSWAMAAKLGVAVDATLDAGGCGVIGMLAEAVTPQGLADMVKKAFGSPVARCTSADKYKRINRVAMCGGSGSFLIPAAIKAGAQAFITSDCKYHDFVDYADDILIIDIGHYESEQCTKEIFLRIISEKFPNFAVYNSATEQNPINYL